MKRNTRLSLMTVILVMLFFSVSAVFGAAYGYSGNIASGAQYDLYTISLLGGETVTATLVCDFDGVSRPLDPVLSVYFPGSDSSNTSNANVYNDDGFGLDDDPNGVNCNAFQSSRVSFVAPVTGDYTFRADGFGSATGPYTLSITTGNGLPLSADGRINPHAHAPIVLYCAGNSTNFYSVTGASLGSIANGEEGTVGSAVVTVRADGRMQMSAPMPDGKTYLFIWDGCPSGNSLTYTIEATGQYLFASEHYTASK